MSIQFFLTSLRLWLPLAEGLSCLWTKTQLGAEELHNPDSLSLIKLLLGHGCEHAHPHGENTQELKLYKTTKVKTKTENL